MKNHRQRQLNRDLTRLSREMKDLQDQLAQLEKQAEADAEAIADAEKLQNGEDPANN